LVFDLEVGLVEDGSRPPTNNREVVELLFSPVVEDVLHDQAAPILTWFRGASSLFGFLGDHLVLLGVVQFGKGI
jgi:hypothetical protein